MKQEITFDGDKHIVIIRTPLSAKSFTQVTCLMSDKELKEAKAERPDLVFELGTEMQDSIIIENKPLREDQGITVKGMTLPHDLDQRITKILEDK